MSMVFVRAVVLLTSLLSAYGGSAQTLPAVARPLSLEEAVRLAASRSEELTIARAGVTRASGEQSAHGRDGLITHVRRRRESRQRRRRERGRATDATTG